MARKSTIARNPLDAIIPVQGAAKSQKPALKKRQPKAAPEPAKARERVTIQLPVETVERARNAAYWDRTPLAQIIGDAIETAIDRLEKARGEAYPERDDALRAGRPLKRR